MKRGDKCWTVTSVLREGVVSFIQPEFVRVRYAEADIFRYEDSLQALPPSSVFTTPEAALKECVECRDYWERQIVKLNDLLSGAGNIEQIRETEH